MTESDDGESPEEMVDAYGKASSVQFDSGELKLFWDDNFIIKRSKFRTYLRKERISACQIWF